MDANPFATACGYLKGTPLARWGAFLISLLSAVLLVLFLPLLYLFVDMMVWRGVIPSYSDLTPQRQQLFQKEWEQVGQEPTVAQNLERIHPATIEALVPEPTRWEWRWQAVIHDQLTQRIGPEAGAAYLAFPDPDVKNATALPTGKRVGLLSLIAREHTNPLIRPLCVVARGFPVTWQADSRTGTNTPYLFGLFAVALALMVAVCLAHFGASHLAAMATLDAIGRIRRAVFSHANRLGLLSVRPQAAQEAADLFTKKIDRVQEGLHAWLLNSWRSVVLAVLLLVVILARNTLVSLAFVLFGTLIWLVGGQFAAWFRRDSRIANRRSESRLTQLHESMTILHMVKSYLMERFNQTRVERQLTDQTRAEWRRLRGETLSRPALIIIVSFASLVVLYVAGRSVLLGEMSLAGLVVKITAMLGLFWSVSLWITTRIRIRHASGASAAVSEFLSRRVDPGQPIDAEFLQPMQRKLDLVEVSMREPGTGRMLLENVTVSVPRNTRLAVVGDDPDEVEAFAHVLTRFADPTAGEVRIDGKNTRWVTHESLRTQVAMISRRNRIFSDTVANNIGCGDAGFSLPQIIEAAKVAHAHGFVQRLPYGYETLIGNGGQSLRVGEELRIAIARAILRDPSLIIIEEPESPMDDDSRALLDDTFHRIHPGRTLVFLTTRRAILQQVEKVIVLHRGRIVAAGSHEDLLKTSDRYRELLFQEGVTHPPEARPQATV